MKMGNNLKPQWDTIIYLSGVSKVTEKLVLSPIAGTNVEWWHYSEKKFDIIKKLNIHIICQTAVPFLEIYTTKWSTHVCQETSVRMAIAGLFVITKNQK